MITFSWNLKNSVIDFFMQFIDSFIFNAYSLIFNALKFLKWMIWPWQKLRHERHLMSVCQGDISERPILGFMIRFLPELRNFWKEKYENFNVFDFSFSKVYQKIRKLFYCSMQRPDLSVQNKIYKDKRLTQTFVYGGPPFVP